MKTPIIIPIDLIEPDGSVKTTFIPVHEDDMEKIEDLVRENVARLSLIARGEDDS